MEHGMKNLDKFKGCLLGGVAGDALGYDMGNWSWEWDHKYIVNGYPIWKKSKEK